MAPLDYSIRMYRMYGEPAQLGPVGLGHSKLYEEERYDDNYMLYSNLRSVYPIVKVYIYPCK